MSEPTESWQYQAWVLVLPQLEFSDLFMAVMSCRDFRSVLDGAQKLQQPTAQDKRSLRQALCTHASVLQYSLGFSPPPKFLVGSDGGVKVEWLLRRGAVREVWDVAMPRLQQLTERHLRVAAEHTDMAVFSLLLSKFDGGARSAVERMWRPRVPASWPELDLMELGRCAARNQQAELLHHVVPYLLSSPPTLSWLGDELHNLFEECLSAHSIAGLRELIATYDECHEQLSALSATKWQNWTDVAMFETLLPRTDICRRLMETCSLRMWREAAASNSRMFETLGDFVRLKTFTVLSLIFDRGATEDMKGLLQWVMFYTGVDTPVLQLVTERAAERGAVDAVRYAVSAAREHGVQVQESTRAKVVEHFAGKGSVIGLQLLAREGMFSRADTSACVRTAVKADCAQMLQWLLDEAGAAEDRVRAQCIQANAGRCWELLQQRSGCTPYELHAAVTQAALGVLTVMLPSLSDACLLHSVEQALVTRTRGGVMQLLLDQALGRRRLVTRLYEGALMRHRTSMHGMELMLVTCHMIRYRESAGVADTAQVVEEWASAMRGGAFCTPVVAGWQTMAAQNTL